MKAMLVLLFLVTINQVYAGAIMNCSVATDRSTILYADVINDMDTGAYIRLHEIIPDPSFSWEVLKTPVTQMRMNQDGAVFYAGLGVMLRKLPNEMRTREIPGVSGRHVEITDWELKIETEEFEVECKMIVSN